LGNKQIGFVIPVYKESRIGKTVESLQKKYKGSVVIVVADDQMSAEKARRAGAITIFHHKKQGFGRSLIEGLNLAWFTYDCDIVVTMDVDHPIEGIPKLIKNLRGKDVCVGFEQGGWIFSRKIANGLAKTFLVGDVHHPTCGFVAWKKEMLKEIPWKHVKSKWDAIHIELLFWAWKRGAKFGEAEFREVKKKRKYGLIRHLSWLVSFLRLCRLKYLWWWREFW